MVQQVEQTTKHVKKSGFEISNLLTIRPTGHLSNWTGTRVKFRPRGGRRPAVIGQGGHAMTTDDPSGTALVMSPTSRNNVISRDFGGCLDASRLFAGSTVERFPCR
ncbi:hypothetical protein ElyMa_000598000 [Elysia marginata]|uniref:Uncharacterized protein n=1 Tax=Elysia marginata TaxID=1093978 RepID=A0AAV4G781_9GAST|nr:hypothetical protein ElyMa_000598000 [Elysia marginata]